MNMRKHGRTARASFLGVLTAISMAAGALTASGDDGSLEIQSSPHPAGSSAVVSDIDSWSYDYSKRNEALDDGWVFVATSTGNGCVEQLERGAAYRFISVCEGSAGAQAYTTIHVKLTGANQTWCLPKESSGYVVFKNLIDPWDRSDNGTSGCHEDGDRNGVIDPYLLWVTY